MRNKNLIGTGVALITPFNDDFSIDFLSLEKLIENMIENRVNYLVVMGTTAESPTLSSEEQIDILNFVKKIVNNRVPIVFGMGSNDTNKLLKRIKNFDFDGIEAILSTDEKVKSYLIKLIALQMKRSYISWNQSNVQDSQIWEDLEFFSNHKLELDKTTVIPVYPTNNVVRKKNYHKKSIKKNYSRK